MSAIRIQLSALWVSLMLTYFLGDILRVFSGDYLKGVADPTQIGQAAYLGMAALFVIPIAMIFLSLVLPQPIDRWANIVVAALFFLINIVGLPTYASAFDKFLIVVGLVFNVVTVWYAWKWA